MPRRQKHYIAKQYGITDTHNIMNLDEFTKQIATEAIEYFLNDENLENINIEIQQEKFKSTKKIIQKYPHFFKSI